LRQTINWGKNNLTSPKKREITAKEETLRHHNGKGKRKRSQFNNKGERGVEMIGDFHG